MRMNQVKTIITIFWCWYSDDDEDCDDDVGDVVGDGDYDYDDEPGQYDHHDNLVLIIPEILCMKLSI